MKHLKAGNLTLEKYKCRLLWMNELEFGNEFPYCDENNVTLIVSFWKTTLEEARSKCETIPRCKRSIYDASFEPSYQNVGHNKARVRFQMSSSSVQFITDSYGYNLQSFIGEVGGTAGLFLGLSFLSVFDLFEYFL